VGLYREHQARLDEGAIDHDRARAAFTDDAPDVRTSQGKSVTQEVHEQHSGFHVCFVSLTVDAHLQREVHDVLGRQQ
jgi:hypothetical protein